MENSPFWADQILRACGLYASAAGDWIEGQGEKLELYALESYVSRLCRDYRSERELKVVWDVGNASVGPAVVELARRLPGHHVVLNETVDGTFPAHHPDPTMPENLTDLINSVTAWAMNSVLPSTETATVLALSTGKDGSFGVISDNLCKGTPRAQAGCGSDRGCQSQPSAFQ